MEPLWNSADNRCEINSKEKMIAWLRANEDGLNVHCLTFNIDCYHVATIPRIVGTALSYT